MLHEATNESQPPSESFAERLKRQRLKAGLKQEELAAKAGMNRSSISLYESGQRTNPTVDTIAKLSYALGCEVSDLTDDATAIGVASGNRVQHVFEMMDYTKDIKSLYGIFSAMNLTVKQVSSISGLSEASLNQIASRERPPTKEEWKQIQRVLAGAMNAEMFNFSKRIDVKTIPFEPRPDGASASSFPRGRFGPKNDYVLAREALYELEQAQEQMKVAQSRVESARQRLTEIMKRLGRVDEQ